MTKPSRFQRHADLGGLTLRIGGVVMAGLASSVALAVLFHMLGLASPPGERSYRFSMYFIRCVSWSFGVAYALVSLILGWISRKPWAVALGTILPLPIAFAIEVTLDSTSHNLMPFEVILFWIPAFAIAFCGAYCGRLIRRRSR